MRLDVREVVKGGKAMWSYFAPYHYMSQTYHGHHAWVVTNDSGDLVAFTSIIRTPNRSVPNAWRVHRIVVLPDYQGLGVGHALLDWNAKHVRENMDGTLYLRTIHPRLGEYCLHHPGWTETATSRKKLSRRLKPNPMHESVGDRTAWSFKYIGGTDVQ